MDWMTGEMVKLTEMRWKKLTDEMDKLTER